VLLGPDNLSGCDGSEPHASVILESILVVQMLVVTGLGDDWETQEDPDFRLLWTP